MTIEPGALVVKEAVHHIVTLPGEIGPAEPLLPSLLQAQIPHCQRQKRSDPLAMIGAPED